MIISVIKPAAIYKLQTADQIQAPDQNNPQMLVNQDLLVSSFVSLPSPENQPSPDSLPRSLPGLLPRERVRLRPTARHLCVVCHVLGQARPKSPLSLSQLNTRKALAAAGSRECGHPTASLVTSLVFYSLHAWERRLPNDERTIQSR